MVVESAETWHFFGRGGQFLARGFFVVFVIVVVWSPRDVVGCSRGGAFSDGGGGGAQALQGVGEDFCHVIVRETG